MQLIINTPTDEIGVREFNKAFAQVQKELVLSCIRDLQVDTNSKEFPQRQSSGDRGR